MLHLRMIAHGNVQNVGFRDFVCRIGASLSLVGFVKNLPDGTVEIAAEGGQEKLDEFCRRVKVRQPAGIHVDDLEKIEIKEIGRPSFASFTVAF